ncbi:hypothetical protein GOP47_0028069 [Adiantum capillus-veneris]|nr:hypothetical protein GOP47_0028069 [Adiantum capillus-veneris]
MLARLSSSPPFPNFSGGASSFGSVGDTSSQLLNIAFQRFQESMRLRQSSDQTSEIGPYLDANYPALVHKQSSAPFNCLCGSCGSHTHPLHHGGCGGGLMNNLESNLGFGTLPGKLEHDASMTGFGNGGAYELNSLNSMYRDLSPNIHNMVGTSATATLASIEDQLSSFSNLQHVDAFNTDTSTACAEKNPCGSAEGTHRNMIAGLLGHVDNAKERTALESAFGDEAKERLMHHDDMDEKPLLSSITTNNDLSLMMPLDSSWQQPSLLMNEILSESQHSNLWSGHMMSRWQDNMHTMAATPATATGGVL